MQKTAYMQIWASAQEFCHIPWISSLLIKKPIIKELAEEIGNFELITPQSGATSDDGTTNEETTLIMDVEIDVNDKMKTWLIDIKMDKYYKHWY